MLTLIYRSCVVTWWDDDGATIKQEVTIIPRNGDKQNKKDKDKKLTDIFLLMYVNW